MIDFILINKKIWDYIYLCS